MREMEMMRRMEMGGTNHNNDTGHPPPSMLKGVTRATAWGCVREKRRERGGRGNRHFCHQERQGLARPLCLLLLQSLPCSLLPLQLREKMMKVCLVLVALLVAIASCVPIKPAQKIGGDVPCDVCVCPSSPSSTSSPLLLLLLHLLLPHLPIRLVFL